MQKLISVRTWIFFLVGSAFFCEGALGPYSTNPNPQRNQLPVNRQSGLSKNDIPATNDCRFALNFYQALSSQSEGNLLFSPLSILNAIGPLMEGARGTTAAELFQATNRSASDLMSNRQRTRRLLEQLNEASPHYVLTVANRLYLQNSFNVLQSFLDALRSYKMEVMPSDFGLPHAVEVSINQWVAQVTNGNIASLVPPGTLDLQTRLVLANAVFFKGDWETTFPEENTHLRPFNYKKNKSVQVPMMSVQGEFPYSDFVKWGFEMVELPYAGHNVSMIVVLPYEDKSLNSVTRRLLQRPALLLNPGRRMYTHSVTVFLPKFKLEQSVNLKEALFDLGVRQVFEQGKADLSGISGDRELYVSDALHKAAIELTEKGTKASAASAIVIKGRSMNSDPVFRASRPFLFFVRHNPTATIMFLGHVRHLKDASPVKFERSQ